MKKKILKVVIFIALVVIAVLNSYFFTHLYSLDEIWNYGFALNITEGLVPYKDYNMVVAPLFSYLLSVVLIIFGKKLIVYHILIAVMVVIITYLASKKIKFYAILIYVAMLIYSANGYNTFTLFCLFILLYLLDKEDDKYNDVIIPIIVGIMALTKQTLVLLVIPSLIYSKNKKKTLAVYLTIFFSFLLYLISQNNLLQFFDYCLFGMFEFADKNKLPVFIYVFLEIVMIICLLVTLIRSKLKCKDIFYVLMYQIIALPILDVYHFLLGWCAVVYIIFQSKKTTEYFKNCLFIFLIIVEFYLLFATNTVFTIRDAEYFEHYPEQTFLEGRLVPIITKHYLKEMDDFIKKYPEHKLYVFGNYAYIVKLSLDIPVTKFDLINNGNMGYNGASKYIEEIDKTCFKKECLFIVNDSELNSQLYNQTNKNILMFVKNNYTKIYSSSVFGVYITQDGDVR